MALSNVLWERLQEVGKPRRVSHGFPEVEQLEREGGMPPGRTPRDTASLWRPSKYTNPEPQRMSRPAGLQFGLVSSLQSHKYNEWLKENEPSFLRTSWAQRVLWLCTIHTKLHCGRTVWPTALRFTSSLEQQFEQSRHHCDFLWKVQHFVGFF